jgi:hypothetical protein
MGYTFSFDYEHRATGRLKNGAGEFKPVPRHEASWGRLDVQFVACTQSHAPASISIG